MEEEGCVCVGDDVADVSVVYYIAHVLENVAMFMSYL